MSAQLAGLWGQRNEIVYSEEKKFVLGRLKQPRQAKNLLYQQDKPNELQPRKEGPLSFVLFESPFTSVSTVLRGHPSLIYLIFHFTPTMYRMDISFFYDCCCLFYISVLLNTSAFALIAKRTGFFLSFL